MPHKVGRLEYACSMQHSVLHNLIYAFKSFSWQPPVVQKLKTAGKSPTNPWLWVGYRVLMLTFFLYMKLKTQK